MATKHVAVASNMFLEWAWGNYAQPWPHVYILCQRCTVITISAKCKMEQSYCANLKSHKYLQSDYLYSLGIM